MSIACLTLWFVLGSPAFAADRHEGPIPEVSASTDPAAAWAKELVARRSHGIAVLEAYEAAGVFPVSPGEPGFHHQFVDVWGNRCAVAQMILSSGQGDAALAAAATQNDVVLAELTDGPLVEWMLTSGFTREEIAIVQEPGWRGAELSFAPDPGPPRTNTPEEIARVQTHLRAVLPLLRVDTEKSLLKAQRRLGARAQQPPYPSTTM